MDTLLKSAFSEINNDVFISLAFRFPTTLKDPPQDMLLSVHILTDSMVFTTSNRLIVVVKLLFISKARV